MNDFLSRLDGELESLRGNGLYRSLQLVTGIDFCSNDYLGLGNRKDFRDEVCRRAQTLPFGSPASRLLRGTTPQHLALEKRLAEFKGCEAAILFPSGYQANVALLSTLIRKRDRVISDKLNHASLIDGIRLSNAAVVTIPHLDVDALKRALDIPFSGGQTFVVTESLFSMDGDIPPLDRYADLAETHGAQLIVDDAHATGLFGSRGSGLVEEFGIERHVLAVTSTFGKAFGCFGAFVAGRRTVIDYLVNRARPLIFTTAPPPFLLAGIDTALDTITRAPNTRSMVLQLAEHLRTRLRALGFSDVGERGPIVPVKIGDVDQAVRIATALQKRGFDVRAIRPPTVPRRGSRLRISVHADHTKGQLDDLADAIAQEHGPVA